jgi:hypothetical protein
MWRSVSGSFGAVPQREHGRSRSFGSAGRTKPSAVRRWLFAARCFRAGWRMDLVGGLRSFRFRRLFQPHNILVRNLPPKMLLLPALHQVLLQKNRASGIGHKRARSGQKDVAGAVMHLDPVPQKAGIAGHTQPVSQAQTRAGNSTEGLPRKDSVENVEVKKFSAWRGQSQIIGPVGN